MLIHGFQIKISSSLLTLGHAEVKKKGKREPVSDEKQPVTTPKLNGHSLVISIPGRVLITPLASAALITFGIIPHNCLV